MGNETSANDEKEVKEVKLSLREFFTINFVTFLIPLYFCLAIFLFVEYFIIIPLQIPLILHLLILSVLFVALYYLYIIVLIEICALWNNKWIRESPPQQGVFRRAIDDPDSPEGIMLKYYHRRGFIIKFPMWVSQKSPFPWLINRTLRKIGHNKIGKNVIYCDSYVGLEFTDLGDNVFIYPTTALSTHAVNSIFGKISILEIIIGKNSTLYPGVIAGPGVLVTEDNVIFPNTVLHKNWRGKPGIKYYQGSPGKPIEINHLEKN
ncbi:MAG: hypothetical protein ACP6IY_11935 [Promethearchaeia archaeon]